MQLVTFFIFKEMVNMYASTVEIAVVLALGMNLKLLFLLKDRSLWIDAQMV